MGDLCHPGTVRAADEHQARARQIAAELAKIARTGMVLPGSLTERRTRCGHPHDYQTWISNDRRLHDLIGQLETLGAAALQAVPRLHRNGRSHPDQPG